MACRNLRKRCQQFTGRFAQPYEVDFRSRPLNNPTTYAECSASSMNIYGLLKLVRLKVLPESYKKIALRSWAAVNARYVKDGVVTGVSAGTDPQPLDG